MFAEMIAGWMILIALIVGAVLVLGRTQRRADPHAWTPAETNRRQTDRDADRRRGRHELRLMAAACSVREGVVRAGSDMNRAARFDRARAELLEPAPDRAELDATDRAPLRQSPDPDRHDLAA